VVATVSSRHGATAPTASVLTAALALFVGGCAKQPSPEAARPAVRYEIRKLERTLHECPENIAPCASVLLEYPEILDAPSDVARDAIQGQVRGMILAPIEESDRDSTPEALMERFIRSYQEFAAEFPESSSPWSMTRTVKPIYNTGFVFSLEMTEESYTGGAHPNSFVRLGSYDARTGKRIALEDVLIGGHGAELRAIGERAFRDARELSPSDDLGDAGFWFEEGVFRLNDNFAVTAEGLRFVFNRYEVAPYALGATEIVLSVDALRGLIRSDGALARPPAPVAHEG
jgi:hypothetical protein